MPKWLDELDDLGLVDSETYRQFIDTAMEKGSLDEARGIGSSLAGAIAQALGLGV